MPCCTMLAFFGDLIARGQRLALNGKKAASNLATQRCAAVEELQ